EGDFTGFRTDRRSALRSGQDVTKSSLKSSSSKEKPSVAVDPSANIKVTAARKGLRVTVETENASPSERHKRDDGNRQESVVVKPKLAVKLAASASHRCRRITPEKEENGYVEDEVLGEPGADSEGQEEQQGCAGGMSGNDKLVRNLKLAKRRGRPLSGQARTGESGQDASFAAAKLSQERDKHEHVVSTDGDEGTPEKDRSPHVHERSPCALKRRKSLFGYRRRPGQELSSQTKVAQSPVEKIPRKRRRLVCYTYEVPVNQEPPAQVPTRQGLADGVVSTRPSRVIRVPKRFMDDEGMSGLLGKKFVRPENQDDESLSESEEANLSQTPRLGSKQKGASKSDDAGERVEQTVERKPSGLMAGGPRKKVGRPVYNANPLKIYESLKMLTASLTQRREQRLASARSKTLGERGECEKLGGLEAESPVSGELRKWGGSDIKLGDLNCPGIVHKVAIHTDNQVISQSETKAQVDRICVEGATDVQSTDAETSEVVLSQGGSMHRINLSGANRRMLHLLKRAKVQLIKIDQQKQMKSAQLMSGTVRIGEGGFMSMKSRRRQRIVRTNKEEASQGQPIGGPRIKHVCRAAAVALGQPRAMVPEDIPRLSALPLHEREGIAPSQEEEDLRSHSEPESTGSVEARPVYRHRGFNLRQRRCFNCKGCCQEEDCGTCVFCLDKPKYGGPNKKRQSCIHKKCLRIEENKMRRLKVQMKRRAMYAQAAAYSGGEEEGAGDGRSTDAPGSVRRRPKRQVTRRCFSNLLESDSTDADASGEDVAKEQSSSDPSTKANDASAPDVQDEAVKPRRPGVPRGLWGRRRITKSSMEHTAPSVLATVARGFAHRDRQAQEPAHKIRVDFKEDCNIENVWAMGGLSVLTSVPITAEWLCLLCASKGHHNMIFCQMCCEPFHRFCLPVDDRPQNDTKPNWCCKRCKFCHVCGCKGKQGKPVLQCKRCFYCYHPSCLGPTYPKPVKCNTSWVCMLCIRCKSCGVTPGKSCSTSWNHELDLCPDCSNLHKQGNFCTVCLKCYPEHEFDKKMMQCARCAHWVHPKCEGLTDDLHEILKRLRGKSLVFSCAACSKNFPSGWQEVVQSALRSGLEKIMTGLMSSLTTCHLQKCSECEAWPDADIMKTRKVVCDLHAVKRKFEEGLYTSLKAFHEDMVAVLVKQLQHEESLPEDQRPTGQARALYIKLLEQTFTWFDSQDPKAWKPALKEFPSGMLPEAIIPPSEEHSYAQWLKEHDHALVNENQENLHLKAQGKEPLSISRLGVDKRHCSLCQQQGDAKPTEAGRLLYLGQNEWAHVNCCIWSAEVQEVRGALVHVHSAVARGRFLRCERCGQPGATVGCCLSSCQSNYHFMCARGSHCVFQSDKKVYCYKHRDLISNKVMNGFEVLRRVYVDFEGINLRRKFLTGLEPDSINVMIGSLQIHTLGVLTELSSNAGRLFPVGYQCSRWYWSTIDPRKPCKYTCRVMEVQPSSLRKVPHLGQNQEENCTIAHSPKPHEDMDTTAADLAMQLTPSTPSPNSKPDSGTGYKMPGHPHSRRPAGGTFRPLPSPGIADSSSHHILTISDLDETRRSRRISLRSRNASPPHTSPTRPTKSGSGGGLLPRSLPFSSPVSPLGAQENSLSSPSPRRRGRPPSSPSGATSAYSPRQGSVASPPSTFVLSPCHSPKIQQHLKITPKESAEVPQDFSSSLEPEYAAGMPEEGVSMMAVMNDGDTTALSSDHELLSTPFDPDTDVAVASVLNEKLEFDEALLNDNVALHFGQHGNGAEMAEQGLEQRSNDEGSDHYFNFSRTVVVCDSAKDSAQTGLTHLPNLHSISQLDGADNNSESDAGEGSGEDNTQDVGNGYHSQGTAKGTASVGSSLVCTGKNESRMTESVHMSDEPNMLEKFQGSACITQMSGDVIVDSIVDGFTPQEGTSMTDSVVPVMRQTPDASAQDMASSSPVFDTRRLDALMDTEPLAHLNEVVLDPGSGDACSSQDRDGIVMNKPVSVSHEKAPEQIVLPEKPPLSNVGKVRIITSGQAPHRHYVIPQPVVQHRVVSMAVPSVVSLPQSINLSTVSTSPAFSVFPQRNRLVTTSPVVINGLESQLKDATKGRPLVIRFPTSAKASVSNTLPSPQVLLVNRTGQILIKDTKTNSYMTPSANSSSYSHISEIAKIIHNHNLVQKPVMVTQVPQASSSQGPTTRVVSFTNGAAPATKYLISRITQKPSAVQLKSGSVPVKETGDVKLTNVSLPGTLNQGEDAQAILERAMASHRDMANPSVLSPSHCQIYPVHNKLQSSENPSSVKQVPELHHQLKTNILSHSRPQVRVKRVSSLSERTGFKQATSTDPTVMNSQDELNSCKSARVRIKAPTIKEVLHFKHAEVENLCEPKSNEAKESEIKRSIPKECDPSERQENERSHDTNQAWVSSQNSDLSDWCPCSGLSSDEDFSPPFKNNQDGRSSQYKRHLMFRITSDDGFSVEADSIEVAWKAVVDGVQEARTNYRLEQLPMGRMSAARVLGVVHNAVQFLLEQLQGASRCYNHRFRFHQQEKAEEELPINPSGCARVEVYTRKNTFDMFNFLASQHRQLPESRPCDDDEDDVKLKCSRRATSTELPMAMRFRHIKKTSKEAVGVYRSAIHGRGLFCKRNIEAGEMVIEYAGNVIRAVLTDKREDYYSSK
ncbi:histone-lysine N-methyltransferase 2B-like isoform X3, partial [Clarias magur]